MTMATVTRAALALSFLARLMTRCEAICYATSEQIALAEDFIGNDLVQRTYTLCEGSTFSFGQFDFDYELKRDGLMPPFQLRPNMHIRCGENGDVANGCIFSGGDYQIDATNYIGNDAPSVDNVVLEGMTFVGAKKYSLWASIKGHITFRNCAFRGHTKSVVPILMDYVDPERPSQFLKVTFEDCTFSDNRFFGFGSNTALIYGGGSQNHLEIKRTKFENNDMTHNNTLVETRSFLVETMGPLTLESSCFMDNKVGVSPVAVFGNTFDSDLNYAVSSSSTSSPPTGGQYCPFASVFATLNQFETFTPDCFAAGESRCRADDTAAPTRMPSASPSDAPSASPSAAPSDSPSVVPTSAPTGSPSATPSLAPSSAPSSTPTGLPSIMPSVAPSLVPSDAPTKMPSASPTDAPIPIPPSLLVSPTVAPSTTSIDRSIGGGSSSSTMCVMTSMLVLAIGAVGLLI